MNIWRTVIAMGIICLSVLPLQAQNCIFVSTAGNDNTGNGTFGVPYKTIARAKQQVQVVKQTATGPIGVYLRAGTYYLDSAVIFGVADGGSAAVPITYSAYRGEKVIISGGIKVTGTWTSTTLNGVTVQTINIGANKKVDQLFLNGTRQILARYPNYNAGQMLQGYTSSGTVFSSVNSCATPQEGPGYIRTLHSSMWGTYYFAPGKNGSIVSANDGGLVTTAPVTTSAADAYTVDYTTTTGTKSRWVAVDVAHAYPDLSAHDAKALTYTTPPLERDVEITGHPVVHVWLNTEVPDLDVFVYLEQVDRSGKSTYITEGDLRASHRQLSQAPFNNFGLPYQSHFQTDLEPIPAGEPFEMVFSLLPTSYQFHAGGRIRITVAFADAGNFDTPVLYTAPTLQLLREIDHPSYVELPVIP